MDSEMINRKLVSLGAPTWGSIERRRDRVIRLLESARQRQLSRERLQAVRDRAAAEVKERQLAAVSLLLLKTNSCMSIDFPLAPNANIID